ncbi:MAG: hypothetical protein ACFCVK_12205 [Acidimicrobiales bacterium]
MTTMDPDVGLRRRARRRAGARRAGPILAALVIAAVAAMAASTRWPSTGLIRDPTSGAQSATGPDDPDGPGLLRGSSDGPRFGLTADERAVAVARSSAPLPVRVDDRVDLLAVGLDGAEVVVAVPLGPARVVDVDERTVTVAVPTERAPDVVTAQATGTVALIAAPG